jgi:hypothetical protein
MADVKDKQAEVGTLAGMGLSAEEVTFPITIPSHHHHLILIVSSHPSSYHLVIIIIPSSSSPPPPGRQAAAAVEKVQAIQRGKLAQRKMAAHAAEAAVEAEEKALEVDILAGMGLSAEEVTPPSSSPRHHLCHSACPPSRSRPGWHEPLRGGGRVGRDKAREHYLAAATFGNSVTR